MNLDLSLREPGIAFNAISPYLEMGAYEALWKRPKTSFKSLAELFSSHPDAMPSDFVEEQEATGCAEYVARRFEECEITGYGVQVHGSGEYPGKLRDAVNPVEVLYYQGYWNLINSPLVAIVGTRKPSRQGIARTRNLVRQLVNDGYTIVSGLAAGIDRVAHETAIEEQGQTIAVLGTPLSRAYPKENTELQREISSHFLVISQVPVMQYESQDYRHNRFFFPERNITMSALAEATIIVEASDTSGTLIQAREALRQGRKLFILDSCFGSKNLAWPDRFVKRGAIRVKEYGDVHQNLSQVSYQNR